MKNIRILSLFDGISCGRVAFDRANINVSRYVAYEIDKYAKAISKYNYNEIEQYGNVLNADFSQYKNFDFLIGGSPCTYYTDNLVIPNFCRSLIHKGFCCKNSE